jgi:hypothetical protein
LPGSPVGAAPSRAAMLKEVSITSTASTASPRPAPDDVLLDGRASARASSTRTAIRSSSSRISWKRSRRLVCSMLVSRNFIAAQGTVR